MGAFTGLKDAKRGYQSNPLKPGEYVVRIDECVFLENIRTQSGGEADMWKNTLTILAVIRGEHREGEIVNTFFKCGGNTPRDTFQANLKGFVAGVLDCPDELIDEAAIKRILGDENPLKGHVCIVRATERASKKNRDKDGNPFNYTVYSWGPTMSKEEIMQALGEERVAKYFPNGL